MPAGMDRAIGMSLARPRHASDSTQGRPWLNILLTMPVAIGVVVALLAATAHPADAARTSPTATVLTTAPLRFIGGAGESGTAQGPTGMPAPPLSINTPMLSFHGVGDGPGATAAMTVPHQKTIRTGKLIFIGPAAPAQPRRSR